ncbi:MAG: hypothetical protein ACLTAX_18390 [Waltera sp.]
MTKNPGILEAVKEVRHMSLGRWARAMYDGHMKMVRDQQARDAYVRDSGAEQERARLSTLIAQHGCCRGGRSGCPFAGSGIRTGNVKKI